MSQTSDRCFERLADKCLNRSIIAEIQRRITKRGKRNVFFRSFYTDDEETITAWKSNLDKIRHVFNVRSFIRAQCLLTFRFQTEFTTNMGVNVPEIRHGASNIHVVSEAHHDVAHHRQIVSEVRGDVAGGRTAAPSVLFDKMGHQEHANDKSRAVSTTITSPAAERSLIST